MLAEACIRLANSKEAPCLANSVQEPATSRFLQRAFVAATPAQENEPRILSPLSLLQFANTNIVDPPSW